MKVGVNGSSRMPAADKLELNVDGSLVHLIERVGAPRRNQQNQQNQPPPPQDPDCTGQNGNFTPCWTVQLRVKAGTRDIEATFLQETEADIGGVLESVRPAA